MPPTSHLATDLVVFSHLRWSFVYQRPQHLLSRLAGRWRIVFIEEPVECSGPARLETHSPRPGLTVVVPHTPVAAPGFHDDQLATLEPLLGAFLRRHGVHDAVAWLYTPMALPLVKTVAPAALVYDCMDELSAFKLAPRQLRQRESALLKRADVVFTGGPSLYEAKRDLHPNVHCVPSSVDAAHFSPAGLERDGASARRAAALQGAMATPRLGYYGVIDERLDLALVAALADARASWQIVMVGPVVKIDPASLPQRTNLHWLGMQPYELLPHLMADWDVCLMPFAMNESTRFISPTKTLEYMAGGKPVVSTPVHDVRVLYGDVVDVADTADDFIRACDRALTQTEAQSVERRAAMQAAVSTQSWDRSADLIHAEMSAVHTHALEQRRRRAEPVVDQRDTRASDDADTRLAAASAGS